MNELDVLLEKYAKGEISQEEQVELNRLTHRDEVLAAAGARAQQLRRKQLTRVSAFASLLVVAAVGIALYLRPAPVAEEVSPIMAQTDVKKDIAEPEAAPALSELEAQAPTTVRRHAAVEEKAVENHPAVTSPVECQAAEPVQATMAAPVHLETEAVVACNSQCSPDSVINDIWKFLKA